MGANSGWTPLIGGGQPSFANGAGLFLDTPFGGCGSGVATTAGFQQFRVYFNGMWIDIPQTWIFTITTLPFSVYLTNTLGLDGLFRR